LDPFDRIWDADRSFTLFHVATGFKIQLSFKQSSLVKKPPPVVLQTGRVLARRNTLTYSDAILPRRGSITRAMARRLQEYWARDAGEGHRILISFRVDFGRMD